MTPFTAAIRDCTIPLNAMPKMSCMQVNDACGAGDVLAVSRFTLEVQWFVDLDKDYEGESGFVGYCCMDRLPRGMGTTGLICICFR
jgi:hypothetical protein